MTLTVSVSDLRNNISSYLERVTKGARVLIRDEKRNITTAQIIGKKTFNPHTFGQALRAATGIFTAGNHPEWRTKKKVIGWVEHERAVADRNF